MTRMARMIKLVKEITGKDVHFVDIPGWYKQTDTTIEVSDGPSSAEDLVHEVVHWIVADDENRDHPDNLGYGHSFDDYQGRTVTPKRMWLEERVVARVQYAIYALAGRQGQINARDTVKLAAKPVDIANVLTAVTRADAAGWSKLLELVQLAVPARRK